MCQRENNQKWPLEYSFQGGYCRIILKNGQTILKTGQIVLKNGQIWRKYSFPDIFSAKMSNKFPFFFYISVGYAACVRICSSEEEISERYEPICGVLMWLKGYGRHTCNLCFFCSSFHESIKIWE